MSSERERPQPVATVRQLGKGGMATVHEAVVAGRRVAIKRPRPEVLESRPETLALFEREYYTLAQLAHPNIIEVYDYGIDAEGPYYSMELLDGGIPRELLPMPWVDVCRLLRDVAAALAMVHSRRLVHRDVSLHNVRLTASGRAKLIDFGALAPIGIAAQTIGTPAYMAPEAVYRQALDQRTDLYALGALGYRLLCGEDAYRARRIQQLRDAWRSRPRSLCDLVPEIPPPLDALIRQLLSLNPEGRCRTAAEVFVRLGALAGLDDTNAAEVVKAYLTMPALVGRDQELTSIRRQILQAARGEGSALLVEGPPGAGRSRVLDACILDGQLLGALVLRARPVPGNRAVFHTLATLASQLLEARPGFKPSSPRIQALIARELAEEPSADQQLALQDELVAWMLQAAGKALLLIVDDLHLVDRDSAAVLARLVDLAPKHRITVVASCVSDSAGVNLQALRLFRQRAQRLALQPLSEEQTQSLVRSLFDDVVNVQVAARRIYEVARGNPQATVDLAEWLVDGGHVVHDGGRWLIPDTLSGLPLPATVDDALRQRLSTLGPAGLMLGAAIAIAGDAELPSSDYGILLDEDDERVVHAALAQLLSNHVLHPHGLGCGLAQAAYRDLLVERQTPNMLATLHRRIAQVCKARGQIDWAIYHLFYGQAQHAAVDLLLSRLSEQKSPSHILHSLEERVRWLREVLTFCVREGRSAAEVFAIKNELVRRAEIKASLAREEIQELSARYKELTGYTDWAALPATMDPGARIRAALQAAGERHRRLSPRDRVMAPRQALASMIDFVSTCLAATSANTEIGLLRQMPPLAPFAPLSDSIRLLSRYVEAVEATIGGRADVASAAFIEVLTELEGETGQNLGPTADRLRRHAMIAVGMLNAGMGRSIALDYADRLAILAVETKDAYAKSTSLRIRHQYHLRRGNWRQAQHWQHEVELDKLSDRSAVFNPSGVYSLSWIYAMLGNAAGMRECLTQMREYSEVSGCLRTWERYMQAEYDRLRGAGEQALPQYAPLLEHQAGEHLAWLYASYGVLHCYESLGRWQEGLQVGEALLEQARAAKLSAMRGLILRPLSLIEARLGLFERAVAHLSENIEQSKRHGMGGMNLGMAYEYRARVAMWQGDRDAFEHYAELCAEQYHAGGGSSELTARFDQLLNEARQREVVDAGWQPPQLGTWTLTHEQVELRDRLADCPSTESRCQTALLAILRSAGAEGGHLFGFTQHGLKHLSSSACDAVTPALIDAAERYLDSAAENSGVRSSIPETTCTETEGTTTGSMSATGWRAEACDGLLPHVLTSRDQALVGIFLLRAGAAPLRRPDALLMDVVGDMLLAAGDARAMEKVQAA